MLREKNLGGGKDRLVISEERKGVWWEIRDEVQRGSFVSTADLSLRKPLLYGYGQSRRNDTRLLKGG